MVVPVTADGPLADVFRTSCSGEITGSHRLIETGQITPSPSVRDGDLADHSRARHADPSMV